MGKDEKDAHIAEPDWRAKYYEANVERDRLQSWIADLEKSEAQAHLDRDRLAARLSDAEGVGRDLAGIAELPDPTALRLRRSEKLLRDCRERLDDSLYDEERTEDQLYVDVCAFLAEPPTHAEELAAATLRVAEAAETMRQSFIKAGADKEAQFAWFNNVSVGLWNDMITELLALAEWRRLGGLG
jgi:hypothetical protein